MKRSKLFRQITQSSSACEEYLSLTRRGFLKVAGMGTLGALTAPTWMPRVSLANTGATRDVLVVVFLRGAIDGLNAVVPYADPDYYAARPTLAVPAPGQTNGALRLDNLFGLAPALSGLLPAWSDGVLGIVHATGSTDPTRSHFEGQKIMEYAYPNQIASPGSGWLARHLLNSTPASVNPLRGMAAQLSLPHSLDGAPNTIPVEDPSDFTLPGIPQTEEYRKRFLRELYESQPEPVRSSALNTLDTLDLFAAVNWSQYAPGSGLTYPTGTLGVALKNTAAVIKADLGVEVIAIDFGGWDTHANQGTLDGLMATLMQQLGDGLATFYQDLGNTLERVTVVVMSEFGRRVEENGSAGTDHGHGSVMLLLGGAVNGGRVHGSWPGLRTQDRHEQRDLAITTDYRNVLGEVLSRRMGQSNLGAVFPGHSVSMPGIVRS